jgi:hypothetical protein
MFLNWILTLAQQAPWEDPPPPRPAAPPPPRMSFNDLQKGLQQWQDGTLDSTMRNGLLAVAAIVILVAIIANLRRKLKGRPTEDSEKRLAREIARVIPFPLGSRMMLRWVARSMRVSLPALLLSSQLFDHTVSAWAQEPTYVVIRHWGYGRLMKLRDAIFERK